MEVNRDCDTAVRINSEGIDIGTPTVTVATTCDSTIGLYIFFDVFEFEIIGMARTAPSTGVNKFFLRLKNDAIRSDYFAIGADGSLVAGIVGAAL